MLQYRCDPRLSNAHFTDYVAMLHFHQWPLTPTSFLILHQCSILTPQKQSFRLARAPFSSPPSRPLRYVVVAGKKKGGGGGGGGGNQKRGAGGLVTPPKVARPYLTAPVIMQNLLLIESHFRKTGRSVPLPPEKREKNSFNFCRIKFLIN